MALFFKERMDEQIEDPETDMINFSHTWIMGVPRPNENENVNYPGLFLDGMFRTTYNFLSEAWSLMLTKHCIQCVRMDEDDKNNDIIRIWKGSCCISYKLFYDRDMRFEFYSSKRVSAVEESRNVFITPDAFTKKFYDAYKAKKIATIVIFIELVLPAKYFYRPFDKPLGKVGKKNCDEYPENMEEDFRFQFLKQSDYSIQCPDGSVPALRSSLYLSSKFMNWHFKKSKDNKLVVGHLSDVIKPLMLYLHSLSFEMPKSFNLDFADRLLKAIQNFEPVYHSDIITTIYQALCNKFVEETFNFNTLLQWLSISRQYSFGCLRDMICVLLAKKYYYKWHQTFPENERNVGNQMFLDVFGSEEPEDDNNDFQRSTFYLIESIFEHSLLTKVILQ